MSHNKLPINLIWKLLARIFDDLSLESLCNDLFENNKCKPESSYEVIYGLMLVLLNKTKPLYEGSSYGITEDIQDYNLDETIRLNTLSNCEVYGHTVKFKWFCHEHAIFIKVLQICESKSSKRFINSLSKYKVSLENQLNLYFDNITLDEYELYEFLKKNFDNSTYTILDHSIMLRNESLYKNLCILSYLVLSSENSDTSEIGDSILNYHKLDCYIVQSYGVREVWNNINRQDYLKGIKHRRFEETIANDSGGKMIPDAIYYFDKNGIKDVILDVKLYNKSCVTGNHTYKFGHNVHQLLSYTLAYPSFINSLRVDKKSRKSIKYHGVDAWILHFRQNITDDERKFNGTYLFKDFSNLRVFTVDMCDNCEISYLDEQIKYFVEHYILRY